MLFGIHEWDGDLASRIVVMVANNPKQADKMSRDRFSLYRDCMTVAEYVNACKATPRPEYALNDITYDSERGFIIVVPPKKQV